MAAGDTSHTTPTRQPKMMFRLADSTRFTVIVKGCSLVGIFMADMYARDSIDGIDRAARF